MWLDYWNYNYEWSHAVWKHVKEKDRNLFNHSWSSKMQIINLKTGLRNEYYNVTEIKIIISGF